MERLMHLERQDRFGQTLSSQTQHDTINSNFTSAARKIVRSHRIQILLVEDIEMIQTMMCVMSSMLGCDMHVAGSGKEALNHHYPDYDLILLDIGLPDIDGFQVAKHIRKQEKHWNTYTPIIVTTAYDVNSIQEKCQGIEVDSVQSKITDLVSFRAILSQWAPHKTSF